MRLAACTVLSLLFSGALHWPPGIGWMPYAAAAQAPPAARGDASAPRIPPLPEREWTAAQRDIAGAYAQDGRISNELRTFLVHPDLVGGVMPFATYIVRESTLPARDRQLLMLRTAWLARSPYTWARYAAAAKQAGLVPADLDRIASGPDAAAWNPFEATLLRAADELHRASFIGDATWQALSARYSPEQLMDATFTIAELTMLAGVANSVGFVIEDASAPTMPRDGHRPGGTRMHPALATPRIAPLEPTFWTGEIRAMLDPNNTGREIAAVYRTFARHPALYVPRQILSEHIRLNNTLPARVREMAILRIGYLCRSEYEWAAHARAGRAAGLSSDEIVRIAKGPDAGWTAGDAAILRAVDELYADDRVGNATWPQLAAQFDRKQLLDFLITAGGYRMVSMALNTFGVPLEANSERLPE